MTAGETFLSTAVRELEEELGIRVSEDKLVFLFKQLVGGEFEFYGQPFKNYEVNFVYLLKPEVSLETLNYQREEIEELVWMDSEKIMAEIRGGNPEFCIWEEEYGRFLEEVSKVI